jgi:hypothetical protein
MSAIQPHSYWPNWRWLTLLYSSRLEYLSLILVALDVLIFRSLALHSISKFLSLTLVPPEVLIFLSLSLKVLGVLAFLSFVLVQ